MFRLHPIILPLYQYPMSEKKKKIQGLAICGHFIITYRYLKTSFKLHNDYIQSHFNNHRSKK